MSTWGPAAASSYWTTSTARYSPLRSTAVAPSPVDLGTVAMSQASSSPLSATAVRDRLEPTSTALLSAFGAFTSHTRPTFATNIITRPARAAGVAGFAPRFTATTSTASVLSATVQVNTRTSAAKSSSGAIGLDLSAARSRLSSDPLGLDVVSPETPSTLTSAAALGLNVVDAATTIASAAEMNGAATSLASSRLSLQNSTSVLEVSGAYTGTASALTFRVSNVPSFLLRTIRFEVFDENGAEVASYSGQFSTGQEINLSAIGLRVRFTEGTLSRGATATTAVNRLPTDVDTAARFDGAWGTAPLFEGFGRVTAGSFNVNGVAIAVQSSDSIDSVLARINASGAGVTAAVVRDRIVLASNGPSESAITLGSDTSGFLQATKLAGAVSTAGNFRDDQQVLSQTAAFAGAVDGAFLVNGVAIAVDRDSDTVASIVARINGAGAGVNASYDADADRIVLQSLGSSEDAIEVSNDTSGFLSAAGLATAATVRGNVRDDLQVLSKTAAFSAVTDGTLTINGTTIAIDADADSLTSVIGKINAAGAGVTAVFNAAANTIDLESDADSEEAIVVGSDSSGLLAAAGLRTSSTVVGSVADDVQRLADTAAFATLSAGTFEVNGVSISLDPRADSLQDVLDRINGAAAGVSAAYDRASDRIALTPDVEGATLTLAGDTTGFLAAARLGAGTSGTRLDADAAFDGSDGRDPLFDDGVRVGAGSFTINGVTIHVAADDTVNGVLARITASAAGVAASYDASRDVVSLTGTGTSSEAITLGADTSGFLAAVKLDGSASAVNGTTSVDPYDGAIGDIAEYASVTAGVLTINGAQVAIDPSVTTLRGALDAIELAGGVAVSLDEASGSIRVVASGGAPIDLTDTSGLLAALGIRGGTYRGTPATTTVTETQTGTEVMSNAADVARAVETAAAALTAALTELAAGRPGDDAFLDAVVGAASDAMATLRDGGIAGLTIGGADADVRVVVDRDALAAALDATADSADVPALVSRALDDLVTRIADAAAAALQPDGDSAPLPRTVNLAAAPPEQTNAGLMFLKALERVVNRDVSGGAPRADSAADGALDMQTRMKIRAGVEQAHQDPASSSGSLLESVVVTRRR